MDATTDGQPPSPTGDNGRDPASGRFAARNTFGQGNPYHKRVAELRSALLDAVTVKDLRAIVKKLVEQAKAGDLACARELFDRIYGRSTQPIVGDVEVSTAQTLTPEQQARADEIVRRIDAVD